MFWLGAIVSLCYVPGFTGAYIATQWPLLSLVLPFFLLRSGVLTPLHWLGLLFIAYVVTRVGYAPAPSAGVFGAWLITIMGMCVWLGTTLTDLRELYKGLAIGAAASSAVAIFQRFGFDGIPQTSSMPAGLYVNSVQQGTVLALLAVALVSERMWLWVLPLLPGIALSGSRGAFLALAVGLLACCTRRLWVFGLVAAVGAFYFLSPLSSSDTQRVLIWSVAWHNLTWLGWGPGMFYTILIPQDGAAPFFPEYAHNDALQLAFEYGIIALLPVGILAAALWRTDAREWPVVVAFVAAGCYSMPLWMPVASFLSLVAVGRVLCSYGVACSDGSNCRQSFIPRWRGSRTAGGAAIPVASYNFAKG